MSRPKFCVGEEVIAKTMRGQELPSQIMRIKMINGEFCKREAPGAEGDGFYFGWVYLLDTSSHDQDWVSEERLRKLPPEERTQWEDTIFQPNRDEVAA